MIMLEMPKSGKLPGPLAAEEPHGRVSSKYTFVKTADVISNLAKAGWRAERYSFNKAKSRDGFQRHAVEFISERKQFNVGEEKARILLINSHDASSKLKFELGFFRLVCSNGLVIPTGAHQGFTLRHLQIDEVEISNLVEEMATGLIQAQSKIANYRKLQLNNNQVAMFAKAAIEIRKRYYATELVQDSVIAYKRPEDKSNDLWTVFNRIQENVTSGGAKQILQTPDGKRMERRLLPITSIKNDVNINKDLWNVMDNFASGNSKRVSQLLSLN